MPRLRRPVAALVASSLALASASASADTFAPGSLVVPMDTDYQDSGMLKAYGLVYDLLRKGVPVRWVIKKGKPFQGVDFTTTAKDHKTKVAVPSHGYRGGPWVVDAADAAKALPIVDAWQAANPAVAVHEATAAFTADVAKTLVVAPKVAMHADGNQNIARAYLMAAGIPDSTLDYSWGAASPDLLTPAQVAGASAQNHRDGKLFDADGDPVYCQFMSMHWGVKDAIASPETVAEVRSFLQHPTHFFAECQGVNAFENLIPYGHFLTPNGYLVKPQPQNVDVHNFDSPFAQFDGAFGSVGGSEPAYALPLGDKYKAGGVTMITEHGSAEGTWDLWMTGYLDGGCPPNAEDCGGLGKVSYLGGHQYSTALPISKNPTTQGTRLFLNSLFDSTCAAQSGLPSILLQKSAPASTTQAAITFSILVSNGGPSVALGATLVDPLPAGATFVSATGGGTFANGKVTWNLGNLGAGETQALVLNVKLGAHGTYANTATLSYAVGLNPFTKDSNTTKTVFDVDTDGDGILDPIDICPDDPNPLQDLATDPANCGACGAKCSAPNAGVACVGGACVISVCKQGFANCDGVYGDGCEVAEASFDSDPANCGGCGQTCSYAHAKGSCAQGACALGACDGGWLDCDGLAGDGCEYDAAKLASDPKNCGACGKACAAGFTCTGGACVVDACPAGFADCNGQAGDGCEYAKAGFASDPKNCGGCGLACALANATPACTAGACAIASCAAGHHDCDGLAADGCEVSDADLLVDPANCGACGKACALANASSACVAGGCVVGGCDVGFVDCDGLAANGCEASVASLDGDAMNCGACGHVCAPPHGVGACVAGVCAIPSCDAGWVDLDGDLANGCEYACSKVSALDATCDGVDDDCDGQLDDDWQPTSCGVGACAAAGACAGGAVTCKPGAPGVEGPAGDASCSNGVDDDCDGDEDAKDSACQAQGCKADADCDDGNACTSDTCAAGFCAHAGVDCDAGAGGSGQGGSGQGGSGQGGSGPGGGATGGSGQGGGATTGTGGSGQGGATTTGTGGSWTTTGGGGAVGDDAGTGGGVGAKAAGPLDPSEGGACACRVGGTHDDDDDAGRAAVVLAAVGLAVARRRPRSARVA